MAAKKYLKLDPTTGLPTEEAGIQSTAGAGDAGKLVATDAGGLIDAGFMPAGITAPTRAIVASEALSAGDLINVWSNAGTANVRKADASTSGKEAHGYVLASVSSSASATVYFGDNNNQVTGLTPGVQFLSAATPGLCTATAPSGAGKVVQRVGVATAAASLAFQPTIPIVLA